eukprot:CAMPEP_0185466320 /NCGR_PEP_ID=MMETSP1365-20130426/96673_1 /TAXON_ID=38817 /ORGANISM="Gephyrocapsa oceanica, Strain RCC1303" /LENGTH=317 /DNA_ID=CAMNT_0028073057 /DNA_START=22 /DNA_END=975 /DNA_ORIENTATION=-
MSTQELPRRSAMFMLSLFHYCRLAAHGLRPVCRLRPHRQLWQVALPCGQRLRKPDHRPLRLGGSAGGGEIALCGLLQEPLSRAAAAAAAAMSDCDATSAGDGLEAECGAESRGRERGAQPTREGEHVLPDSGPVPVVSKKDPSRREQLEGAPHLEQRLALLVRCVEVDQSRPRQRRAAAPALALLVRCVEVDQSRPRQRRAAASARACGCEPTKYGAADKAVADSGKDDVAVALAVHVGHELLKEARPTVAEPQPAAPAVVVRPHAGVAAERVDAHERRVVMAAAESLERTCDADGGAADKRAELDDEQLALLLHHR